MTTPMSVTGPNAPSKGATSGSAKRPGGDADAFSSMLATEVGTARPETGTTARREDRPDASREERTEAKSTERTDAAKTPRAATKAKDGTDSEDVSDTTTAEKAPVEGEEPAPAPTPVDPAATLLAGVIPTSPAAPAAVAPPTAPVATTAATAAEPVAAPTIGTSAPALAVAAGPAAGTPATGEQPGIALPEGFVPVPDGETVTLPTDTAAPTEPVVTTTAFTAAAPTGAGQDASSDGSADSQAAAPVPLVADPATADFTVPQAATPVAAPAPVDPALTTGTSTAAPDAALAAAATTQNAAPAPTAPVTAVTPAPQYAGTPNTPPANQVAMHIAPLRLEADGIHRLTVNLHPVDLGPVSVVAEIRDGNINVQLAGGTEAGREALRASLNDLRRELQDAGFGNCNLDLSQGSPQGNADAYQRQFALRNAGRGYGTGNADAPATETAAPTGAGRGFFTDRGGARRVDTTA